MKLRALLLVTASLGCAWICACSGGTSSSKASSDAGDDGSETSQEDDTTGDDVDAAPPAKDAGKPAKDAGTDAAGDASADGGAPVVRIVSANLTSGDGQSWDPGEGTRILQGLKPDVVLMQELNVGDKSDGALRTYVDATFGPTFAVFRETGASIPNGIVSRWPILSSGAWTDPGASGTRSFVWAQIDVPGDVDLWAVSVHLKAGSKDVATRTTQGDALVTDLQGAVPAGAYVAIGGDFNTYSADEPCLVSLGAVVVTAAPYPADEMGNVNTSAARTAPYDKVLVDPGLDAFQVPVAIGPLSFPGGLVFDTRVFSDLPDVAPAMATDSNASNMQHMAVVKDFALPQ